ncbi:hypothetical protein IEZ26_14070 [Nocardioides cavernae]|uniref:Type IV toxin-antitoxin system AbiEi family antitoxin domain-containing protein n=1 Tax=Nocardioides cavernae TaxID=1921566 RepID=A0ABR8NDL1_9ACTN|nr:hypothetical protein [Nocardioides cavernae]MBD3925756.1 hypothetical protein [Nocardioides cavernae]MBM7513341.1 hypothetical protein [Nocardioides cavernae]
MSTIVGRASRGMTDFQLSPTDVRLRRDLVDEGYTDRDIRRHVRSGSLTKLRYGAYVPTDLVKGLDAVGMMRARSRAVLRTAHPSSVLSHQCALAEYDVPLWGIELGLTHVTRTDGRPGRREAGVVHHRATLGKRQWLLRDGVRVVRPARAVIEVVTSNRPEVGLVVACGVLHLGLSTEAELAEAASLTRHWPFSLNTRIVLSRADRRLTNVAEARVWHFFHEQRIPRPEPQVDVFDAAGNLLGIVDFLWRRLGVFLEFDGRIKYEQHRRPGETVADYVLREKRREEQICLATGWICIRITWEDLARPLVLADRIRRALARRAQG